MSGPGTREPPGPTSGNGASRPGSAGTPSGGGRRPPLLPSLDPLGDALELGAVRVAFAIHIVVALVLSFVPLFDVLGFERAFVSGVLAAPLSAAIGVSMVRSARRRGGDDLARVASHAAGLSALTLVPTLVAGVLVELATQPCDQEEGVLFLLLVAGGNALFGSAIGVAAATLSERRFVPGAVAALVLAGAIASALHRLYAEPQIFVFSLPFGYWPGSLYDEELGVSRALWSFRGYTVLVALALLSAARMFVDPESLLLGLRRPRPAALIATVVLAFAALTVRGSGRSLGFDLDRSAIVERLSRRVVTEHFTIHLAPTVPAEEVARIAEDHELRYAQLRRWFGFEPAAPLESFVYASAGQKRRLMGAAQTQIARPWAREIHIDGFGVPHPVLRHELAHVFAGELASGPFRVPTSLGVLVNIGVVEGLAVAADWPASELTVHGWARAMRHLGLAPDLRRTLDLFGFWSISSARAYTVAGSFIRWLVDTRGTKALGILYASNDFEAAYGEPLGSLVASWERFLDALPLDPAELTIAEHRFKRPGIFQKVCAHKAANLSRQGYERLRSGDLDGGIEKLSQLLAYGPSNVQPLLDIATELARAGRLEEARRYAKRALETPQITEKNAAEAREALAGLDWRAGDREKAREGYRLVLDRHLSSGSDRLQLARLWALEQGEGAGTEVEGVLRPLLLGELSGAKALVRAGALARARPQDGLVRYLYARQLEGAAAYEEAAVEARAAVELGLPGEPLLDEAELLLGRVLLRAGQRDEAAQRFDALAARARSEVLRLNGLDWAERARFAPPAGPE